MSADSGGDAGSREKQPEFLPWDFYWLGYEVGYRRGCAVGMELGERNVPDHVVEDRARELLASDARDVARSARRAAERRHGPAWADLIDGAAS